MQGIVPREILERKRKAFVDAGLFRTMSSSPFFGSAPVLAHCGFVNEESYGQTAARAANGVPEARVSLFQAMGLEAWLASELPVRALKSFPRDQIPNRPLVTAGQMAERS
jgi:hypothetical protein